MKLITNSDMVVKCVDNDVFALDFSADEAGFTQVGNDLAIDFVSGRRALLEDFYTAKNLSFEVEGATVSATDYATAHPNILSAQNDDETVNAAVNSGIDYRGQIERGANQTSNEAVSEPKEAASSLSETPDLSAVIPAPLTTEGEQATQMAQMASTVPTAQAAQVAQAPEAEEPEAQVLETQAEAPKAPEAPVAPETSEAPLMTMPLEVPADEGTDEGAPVAQNAAVVQSDDIPADTGEGDEPVAAEPEVPAEPEAPVVSDPVVVVMRNATYQTEEGSDHFTATTDDGLGVRTELVVEHNGKHYDIVKVTSHGEHGIVLKDGDTWYYVLKEAVDSGANSEGVTSESQTGAFADGLGDIIGLIVKDEYGNHYSIDMPIDIIDDVPEMRLAEDAEVASGATKTGYGMIFDFGADDWDTYTGKNADGDSITHTSQKKLIITRGDGAEEKFDSLDGDITVDGLYGTLTIKPSGMYSYTAKPDSDASQEGELKDTFSFALTDADGDTVTGDTATGRDTLTFTVVKPEAPEMSVRVTEHNGIVNERPVNISVPRGYTVKDGGEGEYGNISFNEATGRWVYTLTDAYEHSEAGRDWQNQADTVNVTVEDKNGNQFVVPVRVDIQDDIPTISLGRTPNMVSETGNPIEGSEVLTFSFGADSDPTKATLTVTGKEAQTTHDLSTGLTIEGEYGTLTLTPIEGSDGQYSYSYQAKPVAFTPESDFTVLHDTFTFKIEDADGDTVSTMANGKPFAITVTLFPPDVPVLSAEASEHEGIIEHLPGTITIPEGIHIVAPEDGEPYKGTHGDIMKDEDGNWIYQLTSPVTHEPGDGKNEAPQGDTVTLTVGDEFGNTWQIDVPVKVIDDIPDVADKFMEGSEVDGQFTGTLVAENEDGADKMKTLQVNRDEDGKPGDLDHPTYVDVPKGGTLVIEGKYGTLTVQPDGSYTYDIDRTHDDILGLTGKDDFVIEEFQFKVIDADDDEDTAKLTIKITGEDHKVIITPDPDDPDINVDPDANSAIMNLTEAKLPGGTQESEEAQTRQGTMAIEALDGVKSVAIAGIDIPIEGGSEIMIIMDAEGNAVQVTKENDAYLDAEGNEVENPIGVLTVSYEATDKLHGTINYKYELLNPVDHEEGKDDFAQNFGVAVGDLNGDFGNANIVVNIADDKPIAADDAATVTEGVLDAEGAVIPAKIDSTEFEDGKKSVLDNDKFGADGEAQANSLVWNGIEGVEGADEGAEVVIKGLYGTFTGHADGTWSYEVDAKNPDVLALKEESEPLKEIINYTITDKDGDPDTATLVIDVKGINHGVTIVPDEPDKEIPGDPDNPPSSEDDPEMKPELYGDRLEVYEAGLRGEGDAEKLVATGKMNISALDGVKTVEVTGPDGVAHTVFSFDLADKTSTAATAENPQVIVSEDGAYKFEAWYEETDINGGVLHYRYTQLTEETHDQAKGKGEVLSHDFTVTVTDLDGTPGKSTIRADVHDDVPAPVADTAEIIQGATDEDGNLVSTITSKEFGEGGGVLENDEMGADGLKSMTWIGAVNGEKTIEPEAEVEENVTVIKGLYGTFTGREDGTWEYTLDENNPHVLKLGENDEPLQEVIRYSVTDKDNDTEETTLTLTIKGTDGTPTVEPKDPDDKIPGDPDVPIDPDDPATQGTKLEFQDTQMISEDGEKITDETLWPGKSGTMAVNASDGIGSVTIQLEGGKVVTLFDRNEDFSVLTSKSETDPAVIPTAEGELRVWYEQGDLDGAADLKNGVIHYTFVMKDTGTHDKGENDDSLTYTFNVTVKDLDDDVAKSRLDVTILDDEPTAVAKEDTIEEGVDSVNGTIFQPNEDGGRNQYGADGKGVLQWKDGDEWKDTSDEEMVLQGEYGTLTVKADGTWKYELNSDHKDVAALTEESEPLQDAFDFNLVDAEGDAKSETLTINITGKNHGVTVTPVKPDDKVPGDPTDPDQPLDPEDPSIDPNDASTQGASLSFEDAALRKDAEGNFRDSEATRSDGNSMEIRAEDGLEGLVVKAADGSGSVSFKDEDGDWILTEQPITTDTGTLYVKLTLGAHNEGEAVKSATLEYRFEFTEAGEHPYGKEAPDIIDDLFVIQATDADGQTGQSQLVIHIDDDVPSITLPDEAAAQIEVATGVTYDKGTPFVFDFGADDKAETRKLEIFANNDEEPVMRRLTDDEGETIEVVGKYGKLIINTSDMTYKYEANPVTLEQALANNGEPVEGYDTFRFQITDSDGDVVSAGDDGNAFEMTFHVKQEENPDANGLACEYAPLDVYEAAFGDHFELKLPVKDGVAGEIKDVQAESLLYGTIHEVDGKWVYTQTRGADHSDGPVTEHATVTIELDGKTYIAKLDINIVDAAPTVEGDTVGDVGDDGTATGALVIDFKADLESGELILTGAGNETVAFEKGSEFTIEGLYGTLTINTETNTWSYVANGDNTEAVTDIFTIQAKDIDGEAIDPVTIEVNVPAHTNVSPTLLVSEADNFMSGNGTPIEIPGEYESISVLTDGTLGYVEIGDDGKAYYHLNGRYDASSRENPKNPIVKDVDSFTLELTHTNGAKTTVTIKVDIDESVPDFDDLTVSLMNGKAMGSFGIDFGMDAENAVVYITGADGVEQEIANGMFLDGAYGKLQLAIDNNGNYTYKYTGTGAGEDQFTVRAVDADGDEVIHTVTFKPAGGEVVVQPGEGDLEPGDLPDGMVLLTGDNAMTAEQLADLGITRDADGTVLIENSAWTINEDGSYSHQEGYTLAANQESIVRMDYPEASDDHEFKDIMDGADAYVAGSTGDDVIDVTQDVTTVVLAGDGNDIIVAAPENDGVIDGGMGLDVLLGAEGAEVRNVEVIVRSQNGNDLTGMAELEGAGLKVNYEANKVELDERWTHDAENDMYVNTTDGLTAEITDVAVAMKAVEENQG